MTYGEAQKFLADEMAVLENQGLGPPEWRAQFREAIATLSSCACERREPLAKLGHIDLVYSPEDERHWLKIGLLLGRGAGDINDCTVIILEEETDHSVCKAGEYLRDLPLGAEGVPGIPAEDGP